MNIIICNTQQTNIPGHAKNSFNVTNDQEIKLYIERFSDMIQIIE